MRPSESKSRSVERLLSLPETGQVLGISRAGLYRLIGRGELTLVYIGGRRLVDPSDLRALIEANKRVQHDDDPALTGSLVRTSAEDGGGYEPG